MKYIFTVLVLITLNANAQECMSIIELSKVRSMTIEDRNSIEQHASNFCDEYSRASSRSRSSAFGASYKLLSGTFSSGKASQQEVASRYCSATNIKRARKDSYKHYVESISPNAYSAYESCLTLSNKNIKYFVNRDSVLPKEFNITASYVLDNIGQPDATMVYSASEGVSCLWQGLTDSNILKPGTQAILKCERGDQSNKSFVTIVHAGDASMPPLVLPWQAYDESGIPIQMIGVLQSELANLKTDFNALKNSLGKSLLIGNSSFSGNSSPSFDVAKVNFNSLIDDDPTTSVIEVPYKGSYLTTTTLRVCESGAQGYISATIYHNGSQQIVSATNNAHECATATASAVVKTEKDDTITGQCSINKAGTSGQCSMSVVYLGRG